MRTQCMRLPFLLLFGGCPTQQLGEHLKTPINSSQKLIFSRLKGPRSSKNSKRSQRKAFLKINRHLNFTYCISVLRDKNLRYQVLQSLASPPLFINSITAPALPWPKPTFFLRPSPYDMSGTHWLEAQLTQLHAESDASSWL